MARVLTLLDLPAEMVAKVASHCIGRDILALSSTCKHIYIICHHASVYQESLRLHLSPLTTRCVSSADAIVPVLREQMAEQKSTIEPWSNLTIAAEKIPYVTQETLELLKNLSILNDNIQEAKVLANISLISALIVLGHPTLFHPPQRKDPLDQFLRLGLYHGIEPFITFLSEEESHTFRLQVAFCTAIACMDIQSIGDSQPSMDELANECRLQFKYGGFSNEDAAFYNSWKGRQAKSLRLITTMESLLSDCPRSYLIPFLDLDSSSRLGGGDSSPVPLVDRWRGYQCLKSVGWNKWYQARVSQLVDSIDEGTWFGFYCYGLGAHYDAPMQGLQFKRETAEVGDVYDIQVEHSEDAIGEFSLMGTINRTNGRFRFRKAYADYSWEYTGVMTPLGMCGEWGEPSQPNQMSGYFWLWKSDWMDPDLITEYDQYQD